MITKQEANNLRKYFVLSYIVFWILLGLTGYIISLKAPLFFQDIMKNLSSWSPTIVVLILFKKLYPNTSFKDYLQLHFLRKIDPLVFLRTLLLQTCIAIIAVAVFFFVNDKPLNTITFITISNLFPVFILVFTSGALGEELGWRGYALNLLQRKYAPLMAGLIIGLFWGFWHLPLMILSGYSGLELIYYILAFMVAIISCSVLITFFYNKSKNILIAMWMHFWFNFLLKLVVIDILPLLIYTSAGYLLAAIGILIFNKKELLVKERPTS